MAHATSNPATRLGVTNHAMLYLFETAHQRFTRQGIPDRQAQRLALYMAFRLSGPFDGPEAWKAVDDVFPSPDQGARP